MAHREIIGPKDKNAKLKALVNDAFSDMKYYLGRNADRDITRMSNRNGFFNVTNITCSEVCGNFFGFVIFLHTSFARNILQDCYDSNDIDYEDMLETNLLLLAWQRFVSQPNKRHVIEEAEEATQRLMYRIQLHMPRREQKKEGKQEGSKGWKILKYHVMAQVTRQILSMGAAKTTDVATNERNHKFLVKGHVRKTQRIGSKFTKQVAENEYHRMLLFKVGTYIRPFIPEKARDIGFPSVVRLSKKSHCKYIEYSDDESDNDDHSTNIEEQEDLSESDNDIDSTTKEEDEDVTESDDNNDSTSMVQHQNLKQNDDGTKVTSLSGRYDSVIRIDNRGRSQVRHCWRWDHKNDNKVRMNPLVEVAISDLHIKYCRLFGISTSTVIDVSCFTSAVIEGCTYRTATEYNGSSWYDWANVRFPDTVDSVGGCACAGRIMGLFQYKTTTAFTFDRVEIKGDDVGDILHSYH
ncbi:MAG: hypothetical protein ACO3P6_04915, partial [Pelagibacteraceae bacterium]